LLHVQFIARGVAELVSSRSDDSTGAAVALRPGSFNNKKQDALADAAHLRERA
jgi:hypothetical protein